MQFFIWRYSPVQFIPANDGSLPMDSGSRMDGLGWVQVRVRVVSPVPQGLVQLDQDDHDENPPSTGMKFCPIRFFFLWKNKYHLTDTSSDNCKSIIHFCWDLCSIEFTIEKGGFTSITNDTRITSRILSNWSNNSWIEGKESMDESSLYHLPYWAPRVKPMDLQTLMKKWCLKISLNGWFSPDRPYVLLLHCYYSQYRWCHLLVLLNNLSMDVYSLQFLWFLENNHFLRSIIQLNESHQWHVDNWLHHMLFVRMYNFHNSNPVEYTNDYVVSTQFHKMSNKVSTMTMVHKLQTNSPLSLKSFSIKLLGHVVTSHDRISISFPRQYLLEIFSFAFFDDKHSRFRYW